MRRAVVKGNGNVECDPSCRQGRNFLLITCQSYVHIVEEERKDRKSDLMQFTFYLGLTINLYVAQIKVCLDAKHWDSSRYAFAICIAFMWAKLSPSSVRGTLVTLWYGTILACLWPLACCHCHCRCRHGCRCCVLPSCLSPHTSRINCHCLIYYLGFKRMQNSPPVSTFRSRFWYCFHIGGCI